eukprot:TRINITY_DN12652_c0_g1_i1.p1 TRINITY_DN12652_c0_g1~~TRINITY_DN12652_c0_g1_i1.p1  ORF type:complete len:208 (+),score=81.31 TRINITY_DN12652_c0_g1_i1:323-946(+)
MATEIQVDALPYADPPMTRGQRKTVEAMVDAEMATFPPGDYLASLPQPVEFEVSEMLRQEMARVEAQRPHPGIDRSRFEIVPPPEAQQQDLGAWTRAMQNAKTQLQHQELREENLRMLVDHGKDAWLAVNSQVKQRNEQVDTEMQETQDKIAQINAMRKNRQKRAAVEISQAESQWSELCGKNLLIQLEVAKLEREVKRQRKELETE